MAGSEKPSGHFKTFYDLNFLASAVITDGNEPVYTIKNITQEEVHNGRAFENVVVLHFVEKTLVKDKMKQLPMIINITNAQIIGTLYGEDVAGWVGKKIEVYIDHAVRLGREKVDGLRVRAPQPKKKTKKQKPALTPKSKNWESAKETIKASDTPIEDVRLHYNITDADFKLLTES